jgi:hypothetical protein
MARKPACHEAPKPGHAPPSAPSKSAVEPIRPLGVGGSGTATPIDANPFGRTFFGAQLGIFIRNRCPASTEQLPSVDVHLSDGEVLKVCHVIGLEATWLALAVDDRESVGAASMRTEVIPYDRISRVTIRSFGRSSDHVGFTTGAAPALTPRTP